MTTHDRFSRHILPTGPNPLAAILGLSSFCIRIPVRSFFRLSQYIALDSTLANRDICRNRREISQLRHGNSDARKQMMAQDAIRLDRQHLYQHLLSKLTPKGRWHRKLREK
jgi:hypothetical protein